MNRNHFFLLLAAAVLGLNVRVQSQAPAAGPSPLQQLQTMKVQNQTTLDKQAALLLKLDDLHKDASQIKFLTKRG